MTKNYKLLFNLTDGRTIDAGIVNIPNGEQGSLGSTGKSVYDLWKEISGNENKTFEDFLNTLKGTDGKDGTAGAPGSSGQDNYILDLDNQMSEISCDKNGTILDTTFEPCTATIYAGNTIDTINTWQFSIKFNDVEISNGYFNKGQITLTSDIIATNIGWLNKDVNLIRFIASNTNYGIREAVYTIKKAKGTPIYSIISNYNYIKYYKALRIYEPTILRIFINKRENGILYSNYDVTKDNVKVYASIDELDYKELEYDSVNLSFDVETTISKNIRVKILDSTNYLYDFESFPLISDGIDGIDGNGIEYAFLLITDETVDISKIIAPTINVGTKTLFIEGWHEGNWLDNPPIMTAEKQRIAVSVLKSVNGTWNNSWSTPSLWAVYSKNGENGVGVVPKIVIDYFILKSDYSAITDWCVFNSYLSKEGEAVVVTNWEGLGNPSHLITLSDASNTDCSKKFLDCGVFSGTTGTNAYVHVAYANISSYSCDSSGNQSGTILESNTLSPISSDGTPYKYIGIITDSTSKDPDITINNYKWTKFSGDDGNGYYYSYTYSTLETNGPTAPTYSSTTNSTTGLNEADTNHLLNGFTWFDNVIAPTTDRKIIWQTWMKTDNPVWSTPVIWNRYVTDGTTITSTKIEYAVGTSGTTYPADGWQSTIPSVSAGSYLWTRTTVNYSDGNSTVSYTVSRQANDGAGTSVTINSTSVTYAVSDTSTQPADSEFKFSSIPSGLTIGLYLWNKTTITYSDSTVLTSYSVARIAADGATGKGLHLAYANSANGSKDFSVKYFSGAMYIGTCVNAEEADPPDYSSYTWSRLLGEDGKDSASLIFIFYRSSSQITSWLDADNPSKWTVTTDGEYIPTDSHWTSNPLGVDIEHMYEYVSTRKSTVTNGKATWGNYSEPVIWSHYGQDSSASTGIRVWTENDNITLSCKSTGTNYVATKTIEIRATNNGENLDISSVALGSTITGVSISSQAAKTGYYEVILSLAEDSYNAITDTPGAVPLVVTISNVTYNVYITLSGVIEGKQGDPGSTGPAGISYDIKVNKNNITVNALGTIKNDSTQVWLNINDVKYYSNGLDSSGKSHNYKFYGVSGTNITAITTETFNLSSIIGKTTGLTSDDFVTLYVTDNVELNSSKSNYIDYETLEVVADGKEGAAADGYFISTDNDRIGINTDTEGKSIALSESAKKVTFHVWHNSTEIAPTTITVANNPDTNATITLPTTYSATGNTVTIDYATGILANTLNEVITFNITFTKEDNTTTTRTATISLIGMRVGASGHSYSLKTSSSIIKITKTSSRTPTTIKAWLVDNNTKITSFTGDYAYWKIVYSTENNTSTAATLWDLTTAVPDSGITTSDISTNTLIFYLLYSEDKTSTKAVIIDSENIEFVLDGINVVAYDLVPDYNVIKITKDGTITPTTITATVNKITGTTVESNNTECVVTYSLDGATEVSSCPAYTASNKYVKIIAKLNGTEVDNETIPILLDGSDNYYLDLDNENITIAVDSTGSVIAGQFPIIVTPHFYKGITELSNLSFTFAGNGDVTFSQSGNTITGTIATINSLNSATANIKISIVINSVTYSKNLKILLAVPGPNGATYYTWIKYADSVGSDGYPTSIYDTPKSATNYIGISYNNLVKESDSSDSSIISHYTWIKIKGENGTSFSAKGKADKHFTSYINASTFVSVGIDVIYLFDKEDNDTAVTSAGILTMKSNLQSISYPSDGDAYVTDNSHIWVKDGNLWIDLGMIKGDKGDDGKDGTNGTNGTDADYYKLIDIGSYASVDTKKQTIHLAYQLVHVVGNTLTYLTTLPDSYYLEWYFTEDSENPYTITYSTTSHCWLYDNGTDTYVYNSSKNYITVTLNKSNIIQESKVIPIMLLAGATFTVTDSIKATVQGHTTQISALDGRITTNTNGISTVSQKYDSISATVESNTTEIDNLDGRVTTTETNVSNVTQTATSLTSTVQSHTSSINNLNGQVGTNTTNISQIKQEADNIKLGVNDTGINIDTHTITLDATKTIVKGNLQINEKTNGEGLTIFDSDGIPRVELRTGDISDMTAIVDGSTGSMSGSQTILCAAISHITIEDRLRDYVLQSATQAIGKYNVGDKIDIKKWYITHGSTYNEQLTYTITLQRDNDSTSNIIIKSDTVNIVNSYAVITVDDYSYTVTTAGEYNLIFDYKVNLNTYTVDDPVSHVAYMTLTRTSSQIVVIGKDGMAALSDTNKWVYIGRDKTEIRWGVDKGIKFDSSAVWQRHPTTDGLGGWGPIGCYRHIDAVTATNSNNPYYVTDATDTLISTSAAENYIYVPDAQAYNGRVITVIDKNTAELHIAFNNKSYISANSNDKVNDQWITMDGNCVRRFTYISGLRAWLEEKMD